MRYPEAKWNPAPDDCYTARATKKIAVCNHRMVGWANYIRDQLYLQEDPPRRISAHFTIGLDGSVEQHVSTEAVAWTQGIKPEMYPFARQHWPLFQEHNPNIDCIGVEHEDGGKPFNESRPMPDAQLEASVKLHIWLFENVIQQEPQRGKTLISHDQLTTKRHNDPGEWVMRHLARGLSSHAFSWHTAPEPPSPPVGETASGDGLEERLKRIEKQIDEIDERLDEHYHKGSHATGRATYE